MRFVKSSSRTSHMKLRTAQSCLLLEAKILNFAAFYCKYTKQVPSEQKQVGGTYYIDVHTYTFLCRYTEVLAKRGHYHISLKCCLMQFCWREETLVIFALILSQSAKLIDRTTSQFNTYLISVHRKEGKICENLHTDIRKK